MIQYTYTYMIYIYIVTYHMFVCCLVEPVDHISSKTGLSVLLFQVLHDLSGHGINEAMRINGAATPVYLMYHLRRSR